MSKFYISYLDLSVGVDNNFHTPTHQIIVNTLRRYFPNWRKFFAKYEGYSLGFVVCTKRGTEKVRVVGPSISKKMKITDFSIFLPDEVKDVKEYLDFVFEGIAIAMAKYDVSKDEFNQIKDECKHELGIS